MQNARQAKRYLATNHPRWRAIRAQALSREPLCRSCQSMGRTTAASHVDHINGRADRAQDYEDSNLQPLCASCHTEKTSTEHHKAMGRKVSIKGCDSQGRPLDADHHWNHVG